MTYTPPFLNFLISCILSRNLGPAEDVLHDLFPRRSQSLAKYLSVTQSNLGNKPLPPPHEAACASSPRLGLNMSLDKFRMAKTFIFQCYVASGTLASVLHLKLSPYVVMYAAMDFDVPLPDDFDMWFLWCHIGQLIQLGRTADLVDGNNEYPPILHGTTIPPEYKANIVEDPDGVLSLLYHFHFHAQTFYLSAFPETKRPLSELPSIQLAIGTTDHGTAGEMRTWTAGKVHHHWFGLRRQPSDPMFESSREAYALLDATCCWGIRWRGRTIRVTLSNQRLVWALNDFIDASAEFPVVEVLLSLATRCGFEFVAIHSPQRFATVDKHALGLDNRFSEGTGLVLQLMDVVLSDVPFARGNLRDLEDVILSTYRAILAGPGTRGYTGGHYTPGLLYAEWRSVKAFVIDDGDVHPAWRSAQKNTGVTEDPIAHSSSPDWQRTLQRRLRGGTQDALDGHTALGECTLAATHDPSLVAMCAEDPLSLPSFHVWRTWEEKMESQERLARRIVRAREGVMRLRAAEDDGARMGIAIRPIEQWRG